MLRVIWRFPLWGTDANAGPAPGPATGESWCWPVTVVTPLATGKVVQDPIDWVESGHKEPKT